MSEAQIKPKQQLLLWELLARGGGAFQKDIKPAVEVADRKALEKLGYVTTTKQPRFLFIEMTDRGWRFLSEAEPRLYAEKESRVSADRRVLQFVLECLGRYTRKNGLGLDEVFRAASQPHEKDPDQEKPRPKAVEREIKDAFFAIAGYPAHDNVRLSALRAQLKHIDRKDLDSALVTMREAGKINLMNLDNPRDIESEGDAALKSGIHTFHLLWIDG